MKKLLSIVLALSLCLTAMMGCFVVSAAETNSVVVTGTAFNVGEAATATATIEIESTGFAAAMLDISFKGLDINAKALAEDETDTGVYEPDIAVTSTSSDVIVFSDNSINDAGFGDVTVANASDSIRLILDTSGETLGYFEYATIVITFVAPAAGSYDVKVDAISAGTAGTYDIGTGAYTGGTETLIKNEDFTITNGAIVVEEKPVEPECEHDWIYVDGNDFVAATETVPGSVELVCSKCEDKTTKAVNYHALNTIMGTGAEANSQIEMKYDAVPAAMSLDADRVAYLIIDKTYHTSAEVFTIETSVLELDEATVNGAKVTWRMGVPANEMTESMTLSVLSKNGDEWYSGKQEIRTFAAFALDGVATGTDADLRKLLVDTVNYGTQAQIATNHYVDNLANAEFTDYLSLGSDTSIIPDAEDNIVTNNTGTVIFVGQGLMAESKIVLRTQILPIPNQFTGDVNDIVVVANYIDYKGVEHNIAFVNDESAVDTLDSAIAIDSIQKLTPANVGYYAEFGELCSNEMNTVVDFTIYNNGVAGSVKSLSVEDAVASMRSSATDVQKAAHNALLRYGNSAVVAFS